MCDMKKKTRKRAAIAEERLAITNYLSQIVFEIRVKLSKDFLWLKGLDTEIGWRALNGKYNAFQQQQFMWQ
jgi:hypothetical protein